MATKVNSLTTKQITLASDAANEYLYITNTLTRNDSKMLLSNLFLNVKSVGQGAPLITSNTTINSFECKSLSSNSDVFVISDKGSTIDFIFEPSLLDLSKCKNTTTPFLSTVNLASNVGATVLPTANGGTNKSSAYVVGDVVYASATDTLAGLAGVATGNALLSGGTGTAPAWGKIGLTTHVSGTLPVGNGGTGATSFTSKGVLLGNNTGAVAASNAGSTNGAVLLGNASGNPAFAAITSPDSTIQFTTGAAALGLSTRITTLENSSGTAALMVDGTGNMKSQGNATLSYKKHVYDITTATYNVEATESGYCFTLNRAGGIEINLPAAAAGLIYDFHITTTFTGTLTITADSSGDTYTGAVKNIDKDEKGSVVALNEGIDTTGWNIPGLTDYILTLDSDSDGRFLGGHLKFTALSASIWHIEGTLFGDGTVTHIFS